MAKKQIARYESRAVHSVRKSDKINAQIIGISFANIAKKETKMSLIWTTKVHFGPKRT